MNWADGHNRWVPCSVISIAVLRGASTWDLILTSEEELVGKIEVSGGKGEVLGRKAWVII